MQEENERYRLTEIDGGEGWKGGRLKDKTKAWMEKRNKRLVSVEKEKNRGKCKGTKKWLKKKHKLIKK